MNLGVYELCLDVKDLGKARAFYETLGFRPIGGEFDKGWVILEAGNCRLGLFHGHITENLLNFRGAQIQDLVARLRAKGLEFERVAEKADGTGSAFLRDPDGNLLFFDTDASEIGE